MRLQDGVVAEIRFRTADTNVKKVSLRERKVKDADRGSRTGLRKTPFFFFIPLQEARAAELHL